MKKENAGEHHTKFGTFDLHTFFDGEHEHPVLTLGDLENAEDVLCRVSSECLPGTVLGSAECDCKEQLEASMQMVQDAKQGIVIYLLGHEGRGHGLEHKIGVLNFKQMGYDTFTAIEAFNNSIGKPEVPIDVRDWSMVKPILDSFGIKSISCITNSPDKMKCLEDAGVNVTSVANIPVTPTEISHRHLLAKRARGHNVVFTGDKESIS